MTDIAIQAEKMSIGYERTVCADISFELQQGKSLLVTGHNGAGKTTLLKTLFALMPLLGGRYDLLGTDVNTASPEKLMQAGARFLGQGGRSFDQLSVNRSREALQTLYDFQVAAPPSETANSYAASMRIGNLSIGQRRIEALHLLTAGNPRLYLLDEPFAGVDLTHERYLLDWLTAEQQKQKSFVIVEQRFRRLLPLCDVTMVLRAGEMSYLGPSAELVNEKKAAEVIL